MIQMESKDRFLMKYRFRPFVTLLCFLMVLLFGGLFVVSVIDGEIIYALLGFLLTLLMLFTTIMQIVLYKREFHILVDQKDKIMEVDMGIRGKKRINLSEVKGFAFSTQTTKSNTVYLLQFATSPKNWGEFYNKRNDQIEKYDSEYKQMYIVVSINNQRKEDIDELLQFLSDFNLPLREFQPSVLGAYQGVPKEERHQRGLTPENRDLSPLEKKLKRRQWLSYFLVRTFLVVAVVYFVVYFIGTFHGIYW